MNARAVFAEVTEISRLALQMAEAGRAAGLHNIAPFSKDVPPVEEHLVSLYDRSKRDQEAACDTHPIKRSIQGN